MSAKKHGKSSTGTIAEINAHGVHESSQSATNSTLSGNLASEPQTGTAQGIGSNVEESNRRQNALFAELRELLSKQNQMLVALDKQFEQFRTQVMAELQRGRSFDTGALASAIAEDIEKRLATSQQSISTHGSGIEVPGTKPPADVIAMPALSRKLIDLCRDEIAYLDRINQRYPRKAFAGAVTKLRAEMADTLKAAEVNSADVNAMGKRYRSLSLQAVELRKIIDAFLSHDTAKDEVAQENEISVAAKAG